MEWVEKEPKREEAEYVEGYGKERRDTKNPPQNQKNQKSGLKKLRVLGGSQANLDSTVSPAPKVNITLVDRVSELEKFPQIMTIFSLLYEDPGQHQILILDFWIKQLLHQQ